MLGAAFALGLGRALRSLLYGLEGHDPLVFVMSLAVLVARGASARATCPVRRASQVDPVEALRYE